MWARVHLTAEGRRGDGSTGDAGDVCATLLACGGGGGGGLPWREAPGRDFSLRPPPPAPAGQQPRALRPPSRSTVL